MTPRLLLVPLIFVFFSCATRQLHDGRPLGLDEVGGIPKHIVSGCDIYDVTGKLLRSNAGHLCLFENDGSSIISHMDTLTKYDSSFKTIWQHKVTAMHHQFQKSVVNDGLLVLDSEFHHAGNVVTRPDIIKVLDKDGTVLKKLNFDKVLADLKKAGHQLSAAKPRKWIKWIKQTPHMKNLEYSHVNSFAELYDVEQGKKILKGYVLNCLLNRKIILMDTSLTHITDVISIPERRIHEVQQIQPGKLVFYQNSDPALFPKYSSVVTFDLATREFSEIHAGEKLGLSAASCSSLQLLPDDQLFITHSNCHPVNEHATFEYVDLKKGISAVLAMDKAKKINAGYLLNLSEYLKNNPGL